MRRTLTAILSAFTLLTFGCKADGGKVDPGLSSGATQTTYEPTRAARVADGRPVLVCFGDSITAGYGIDNGQTYPQYLQSLLDRDGYPYRVVNAGVSGNTTKDALDRVADVLAKSPAIVVVEFGGNDALRGLPLEQTKANLASVVEQLQAANVRVALAGITIPPDYGQQYVSRFNAIYPAVAAKYRVPYLPFVLKGAYGVAGSMQADGIHPTTQGAAQVALNIETLVKPLLKH
ncbi:arylesterase [Granulicella cerasi]|uniref:Arylesterase n=1 Tax=Granulicella cerasi TaxID=741063 RepID=A0ABW1ZF61_9BACT|nr:arylesterase [Granulicella cerasi]